MCLSLQISLLYVIHILHIDCILCVDVNNGFDIADMTLNSKVKVKYNHNLSMACNATILHGNGSYMLLGLYTDEK